MIVMKFGGTSVGSAEAMRGVARIVAARRAERPIVVVSAVSGVTNKLIAAAQGAQRRTVEPEAAVAELTALHERICDDLDVPRSLVDKPLRRFGEVLRGIYFLRELTARSLDYVQTFGEILSSSIVAAHFEREGMPARAISGWDAGLVTDDRYGEAEVLPESFGQLHDRLVPLVEQGVIPIVTGFIARTRNGERTTLGRGGSDYTAALVGRGVGAREIQIWTDVSGILSADPRVVPDAQVLRQLTFDEASELAYFGAKVLHPKTIEPAVQADIPVRILNTFAPDDPGTVVTRVAGDRGDRSVEGLAVKRGNLLVNITSTRMLGAEGYMARIFDLFHRHGVSVDAIATSEVSVSVTVDARFKDRLHAALPELEGFARVRVEPDRAIVCVVGNGMRFKPGISGRIFSTLGEAGVNIEMISQGSSELNVTFVVTDDDAHKAMRALHQAFLGASAA